MLDRLIAMFPSIFLGVLIAILVLLAIRKLVKDRKSGKSSCSGSCGDCPFGGQCHQKK